MKSIYVGNLNFATSEDSVRSLFEEYGTVDRVSIARNRNSGERGAFGYVEMSNSLEADRAIAELNDRELDGRALNVAEGSSGAASGGLRHRSAGVFRAQSRNYRY